MCAWGEGTFHSKPTNHVEGGFTMSILMIFVQKIISNWLKDISTPDFSTPSFNPRSFNYERFNPRLFDNEFLNHGVETFMVEKSGVEKSGVEVSCQPAVQTVEIS